MRRGAAFLLVAMCGCPATETSIGSWWLDAGAPEPDAASPSGQYLEAEDGALSGGYTVSAEASASAGHFLAAPMETSDAMPGSARARYTFSVSRAGRYVIWGRIRAPDAMTNRLWFQVDGGTFVKWRISTGDIWYWDDLHDNVAYEKALTFELSAGAHELVLANCVAGVALDRLYITADGDVPPGNDTPCHPPHSIERDGMCLDSCGSQGGVGCGGPECMGKPVIDAYDCAVCCLGE
jgi:hypothetical protein